jgi:hypothetical protein
VREFLTEVIQTPGGKVDEQSRLCQSYKNTPEVLAAAFFLRKNDVPHPGPRRCLFVWACRLVSAGKAFNQWIFSAHPRLWQQDPHTSAPGYFRYTMKRILLLTTVALTLTGCVTNIGAPIECQYEFHRVFSVVVLRLAPDSRLSRFVRAQAISFSCPSEG